MQSTCDYDFLRRPWHNHDTNWSNSLHAKSLLRLRSALVGENGLGTARGFMETESQVIDLTISARGIALDSKLITDVRQRRGFIHN